MYIRNNEGRSRNHRWHGKAVIFTCSERMFVALVVHHVQRIRRIILSSMAFPAYRILPHYLINATIKKKLLNKKCAF